MKKLVVIIICAFSVLLPAQALAASDNLLQDVCKTAPSSPVCQQNAAVPKKGNPIAGPNGILQTVTNIMALLSGIVAVIMIIVSGFTFVTAGGAIGGQRAGDNPTKAKKARATLLAAIIGLVIVALSWSFITFIVQRFIQ